MQHPAFFSERSAFFGRTECFQFNQSYLDPPCYVSDGWSGDGRAIIIVKLIIHSKYEGKDPPFDACRKKKLKL